MKLKQVSLPLSLLLSLLCLLKSDARAADKVIVDYGGVSGFQSTTWVAKDLKIFDKHGFDAETIMITGGARSVAALLSGSTQFATGSGPRPSSPPRGVPISRIIAASYNKFPYAFVVKSDIRSPKDLRGKKINILNYGGSNDLALQLALREWGLKLPDVIRDHRWRCADTAGLAPGRPNRRDDFVATAFNEGGASRLSCAGGYGRYECQLHSIVALCQRSLSPGKS